MRFAAREGWEVLSVAVIWQWALGVTGRYAQRHTGGEFLHPLVVGIANGGITAGLKVFIFLSSTGVDLVRKRAADTTQVNPLEPLAKLINDFMARGGTIWACTPCVKSRGYGEGDLLEGVVVTGASVMHERIKAGAATLSF
jgi:predicted peroxiredoxin